MACRRTRGAALFVLGGIVAMSATSGAAANAAERIDLAGAVVVVRTGALPKAESAAATVLVEEVERRTGIRLPVTKVVPTGGVAISLATSSRSGLAAEGFRLAIEEPARGATVVRVTGADGRGVLYGVGHLLRKMDWRRGAVSISRTIGVETAPMYPLRGHQLGYRPVANSWDKWDVATYDRYIRELALFGVNAIENIPLSERNELMPVDPDEMWVRMSEICDRYDIDYWAFLGVGFNLAETDRAERLLADAEGAFRTAPRLDGVFIPGGDPGETHPDTLLPWAEKIAEALHRHHPAAGVWISLQHFSPEWTDAFFRWIAEKDPAWLTGVVHGPLSPDPAVIRRRLPARYSMRHYPDVTHTVRCQYPVPWWDPALSLTLEREASNPRPVDYREIHNRVAPYTDGFLSYSDGVHDDVNKNVWSAVAWNPDAEPRDILIDYARLHFGPDIAQRAADGILALEGNWRGPLATNGGVEGTLAYWAELEREKPELAGNWRWQMLLLRAKYDAFVRARLIHERSLEREALAVLRRAPEIGSGAAIDGALALFAKATTEQVAPRLRGDIEDLCERLFRSIGLQTSVPKYMAHGSERGAILDYVDRPLNDRPWYEDELAKVRAMATEAEKRARIAALADWTDPGPGGFYDAVGDVGNSPHVLRPNEPEMAHPATVRYNVPHFMHTDGGKSRLRMAWLASMHWKPLTMVWDAVDPAAGYSLRIVGENALLPKMNGVPLVPSVDSRALGEVRVFPVPRTLSASGRLVLTFDDPHDMHLNWRQWSYVNEVWLVRQ